MVSPFFRVEIVRFRASLSSRAGSPVERGDSFVTGVSCSSFSLEFLARLGAFVTAEISHADRFFPPRLRLFPLCFTLLLHHSMLTFSLQASPQGRTRCWTP